MAVGIPRFGALLLAITSVMAGSAGLSPASGAAQALPDEDYLWWPLPEGEEQYGTIDGYRIKRWVYDIRRHLGAKS